MPIRGHYDVELFLNAAFKATLSLPAVTITTFSYMRFNGDVGRDHIFILQYLMEI